MPKQYTARPPLRSGMPTYHASQYPVINNEFNITALSTEELHAFAKACGHILKKRKIREEELYGVGNSDAKECIKDIRDFFKTL